MEIEKTYKYGKSRRKLEVVTLRLSGFEYQKDNNLYTYSYFCSVMPEYQREMKDSSIFSAINIGMAGLRQCLRMFLDKNPGMKIYDEIEGDLIELSINDVFWVHDCVSE